MNGKKRPTDGVMNEMDRFGLHDADRADDESPHGSMSAPDSPEPSRERMKALAALADGSLRSAELRAEIEADPDARALLDEQVRAVALVRGAANDVHAPDALRARLPTLTPDEAGAREALRRGRRAPSRSSAPRLRGLLAGAATLAAAVVVVLALSLSGTSGSPTVAQAAALSTRPATLPAPRHLAPHSFLIDRSEAGVPFPYWEDHFHWKAIGARTDALAGRTATTVFYVDRRGRRLAYAIVSGAALPVPHGARTVVRDGVHMWVATISGATVVTWERDGHSCVLASAQVPAATLVRLASWRANGSIPY
jgi:hypothetical protein